jgi:hypothetical protein
VSRFRSSQALAAPLSLPKTLAAGVTATGDLLSPDEVGDVIELAGVKVIPSTNPGSMTPGAGNFAESGEIELHGRHLIFVTNVQSDSSVIRVNLQSGEIGRATGARPVEIYSGWSLVRTNGDRTETIYEHKASSDQPKEPDDIAESYPNLRVADHHRIIDLFESPERDKLIPLLEAEKLSAWARPMGSGEPPPTKIAGTIWKTYYLLFLPKGNQWARNQTYLKTKSHWIYGTCWDQRLIPA